MVPLALIVSELFPQFQMLFRVHSITLIYCHDTLHLRRTGRDDVSRTLALILSELSSLDGLNCDSCFLYFEYC